MRPELAELFAKRPRVIKPGLARVRAGVEALAGKLDLGLDTPSVIVGGTNGKGSTSGFLYQLLAASGERVGLFTSPHLVSFCERIRVADGLPLDDATLVDALARLKGALPPALYDELSFFEVNALLAWQVFRERGTTVNVLEVGLGGRWDATNAAEPELAVITSIGLDHQEYLGHTLEAIAREKAGIMRAGKPVLWGGGEDAAPEAERAIRAEAQRLGARLVTLDDPSVALPELATLPVRAAAWPSYLARNLRLAATAFVLLGRGDRALALARFAAGDVPSAPSLVGRFQRLDAAPPGEAPRALLLDVCHNPHGSRAFARGLRAVYGDRRLPALVSVFGDKDCDGILDELRTVLGEIILYPQHAERAWRREQLATRHHDLAWRPDLASAWQAARRLPGEPLVCCGSVHGIGELLVFLGSSAATLSS